MYQQKAETNGQSYQIGNKKDIYIQNMVTHSGEKLHCVLTNEYMYETIADTVYINSPYKKHIDGIRGLYI